MPVSVRLDGYVIKDDKRNRLTKRASLPSPIDELPTPHSPCTFNYLPFQLSLSFLRQTWKEPMQI